MKGRLILLLGLAGCGGAADRHPSTSIRKNGAILPVVDTVDGVPVMHYDAGALERAPRLDLSAEPEVVFGGADHPEVDLTNVYRVAILPNGKMIAVNRSTTRVLLFDADGRFAKYLGGIGAGPGDFRGPGEPQRLAGDTVLIEDGANRRANLVTPADGVVRMEPLALPESPFGVHPSCYFPRGVLKGGRLAGFPACSFGFQNPDGSIKDDVVVAAVTTDFSAADTIGVIRGYQQQMIETNYRGRRAMQATVVRLAGFPLVAVWDSTAVTVDGSGAGTIVRWGDDRRPTSRIEIEGLRRPVTAEMRQAVIDRAMRQFTTAQMERMVDARESMRLAREEPFADSLPVFGNLIAGDDGYLWALRAWTLTDSTWTAIALRADGAIVGTLTGSGVDAYPVWFGPGRVMLREVDEDGVVRFGVYGVKYVGGTP